MRWVLNSLLTLGLWLKIYFSCLFLLSNANEHQAAGVIMTSKNARSAAPRASYCYVPIMALQAAIAIHPFLGVPLGSESANDANWTVDRGIIGLYDSGQSVSNEYFMPVRIREYVENALRSLGEPGMENVVFV